MSENGQIEQPKGRPLQTLQSKSVEMRNTPNTEKITDFERQLFHNRTFNFNLEKHVADKNNELHDSIEHYTRRLQHSWGEMRVNQRIEDVINEANHDFLWRQRFTGKVPKSWDYWGNVSEDFKRAREQHVQLSHTLVDAGISHVHPLVVIEVANGQRLDVRQMAWLFSRKDFPSRFNPDEIIAIQKQMGATDEDIQDANSLASELREHIK